MTLDPSALSIFCQRCGTEWEKADQRSSIFFDSTDTFRSTKYASPSLISSLDPPEEMIYCPRCHERRLDRALGDYSSYLKPSDPRVDPDSLDQQRPSSGDADVTFTPPSWRKS